MGEGGGVYLIIGGWGGFSIMGEAIALEDQTSPRASAQEQREPLACIGHQWARIPETRNPKPKAYWC